MTVIEVFADVACPFAHAGIRAFVRRRLELGRPDLRLRVRAWPLELVNGKPLDPTVVGEEIAELRAQIGGQIFGRYDSDQFPSSSLAALALAAAAYRQGDDTGEQVSVALRDALFEEGRDISDPGVLQRIAAAYQVGPAGEIDELSVQADWAAGQRLGVEGSPHFFCGPASAFCPSLDVSKDTGGHLRVRNDPDGLDAFLADCLSSQGSSS